MKRVLCLFLVACLCMQGVFMLSAFASTEDKFVETKTELKQILESIGLAEIHGYGEYTNPPDYEWVERNVQLKGLSADSIVLLYSYGRVNWNVSAEEPGKIKAIIALGQYEARVKTDLKVPVYRSTSNQMILSQYWTETKSTGGYKSFCEESEEFFGRPIDTYIYGGASESTESKGIVIDGRTTDGQENQPANPTGKTKMGQISTSRVKFHEAKGNKVSFKEIWWDSYYRSNKAYNKGKYYFEVEVSPSGKSGVTGWTNLGIGTMDGAYEHPIYTGSNMDGSCSYGALYTDMDQNVVGTPPKDYHYGPISAKSVRKGDRIGVAMDLDNHRVFFSKNGKWMNGDPTDPSVGWEIKKDRYYYALGNVDCPEHKEPKGDVEVFYFGDKPFKYKMPEGYVAFGSEEQR